MGNVACVGLDIHKKTVGFCAKEADGTEVEAGEVEASGAKLRQWAESFDRPWIGGIEATMFTGWIYDLLKPYAKELKVAHPQRLSAMFGRKHKNDGIDADKIADALRCNLLPEVNMAPQGMRELRRVLRFRNFLVRIAVQLKNRTSGLLMECGVAYDSDRLHGKRCFGDLPGHLGEVPASVVEMLRFNRAMLEVFEATQKRLLRELKGRPLLRKRVHLLMSISGVGDVLGLTWALEVGEPQRFRSIRRAISYCGLCSAQEASAGKEKRRPLSKQRNKHLQWVLIEAAKTAPQWNEQLAQYHARELERGSRNRQKPLQVKEDPKTLS